MFHTAAQLPSELVADEWPDADVEERRRVGNAYLVQANLLHARHPVLISRLDF